MGKSALLCLFITFLLVSLWQHPIAVHAQSQSSGASPSTSASGNNGASVTTSVTVEVKNETLKIKNGILTSALNGFLNSAPDVLMTSDNDQVVVKTKIENQINNNTQNVQGTDATNAIIGVEITKALKSLVSSSGKSNQTAFVTIESSSTCKPSTTNLISCENTIKIT